MKSQDTTQASLLDWSSQDIQKQIRQSYGKDLNDQEWNLFLQLGKATGLNPFLREIWAVKYGTAPASIFIGRDGYRRSAQNHPQYEYHYSLALYSKDTFEITNGEPKHIFKLEERGQLVGAYCVVKRKNATRPAVNIVRLDEYSQSFGVWKTKKETMIVKVAEAQGLRAGFQELFAGSYDEAEDWKTEEKPVPTTKIVAEAIKTIEQVSYCSAAQADELRLSWSDFMKTYCLKNPGKENESETLLNNTLTHYFKASCVALLPASDFDAALKLIKEQTAKLQADAPTKSYEEQLQALSKEELVKVGKEHNITFDKNIKKELMIQILNTHFLSKR